MSSSRQLAALRKRELDVAFLRPPITDPNIAFDYVLRERIWLIVAEDHPLASSTEIEPVQIHKLALVGVTDEEAGLTEAISRWASQHSIHLTTEHRAFDIATYMAMVRLRLGIGLVPEFATKMLLPGLICRPIAKEAPTLELAVAYRKDNPKAVMPLLLDFIRGILKV